MDLLASPSIWSSQDHFDAPVWEDGEATMGRVVRDCTGRLLLAAGWKGQYSVIGKAETRAAQEALRVLHMQYPERSCWVEGDAMIVIQELNQLVFPTDLPVLLEDAHMMIQSLDVYKSSHTLREGNKCTESWCRVNSGCPWRPLREGLVYRPEGLQLAPKK